MRYLAGCAVCLAVAGCGDNIRMFESGGRLAAVIESGGEDAETLAYFHDRERDIDCTFIEANDGVWRCLPRARVGVAGYRDRECTQPVYQCLGCTESGHATVVAEGCIHTVGAPLTTTEGEPPAFIGGSFGCISASFPPGVYLDATPLEPSEFVSAELDPSVVGGGLGSWTLVADDGARQLLGAFALADTRTCTFGTGTHPTCLPGTPARTERGLAFFFAEGSCTSRIAFTPQREGCEPITHARYDGAVHIVSELSTTAFERSAIDSSCFPTLETNLTFWAIGEVDGALPVAELHAPGVADARPVFYAALGRPIEPAHRWVDREGRTCFTRDTLSAGRRCIPKFRTLLPSEIFYTDPQCSVEIVYNPEDAIYGVEWDGVTDPNAVNDRSVVRDARPLTRYLLTEVFEKVAGACVLRADPGVLMSYVHDPVDLARFPAITLEIREAP